MPASAPASSCARLPRRALIFIEKLLQTYMEQQDKSLKDCTLAGYEVSLKPHHGMIVRGTFTMCVKACPKREDFTKMLDPDPASVGAGLSKMMVRPAHQGTRRTPPTRLAPAAGGARPRHRRQQGLPRRQGPREAVRVPRSEKRGGPQHIPCRSPSCTVSARHSTCNATVARKLGERLGGT